MLKLEKRKSENKLDTEELKKMQNRENRWKEIIIPLFSGEDQEWYNSVLGKS